MGREFGETAGSSSSHSNGLVVYFVSYMMRPRKPQNCGVLHSYSDQ